MAFQQQEMPQQERPRQSRTKSMLSFSSNKSGGSGNKLDLTESPKEKAHRRINSKNDPNMAIKELQPGQAQFDKTTIDSLSRVQHKDIHGNIISMPPQISSLFGLTRPYNTLLTPTIADPDRSNPTRSRMERPLDTIRSFEAAIDGSYSKRTSTMMRPGYQSRRSSYHQGFGNSHPRGRWGHENGYNGGGGYQDGKFGSGGRMGPSRPDSYYEGPNQGSPAPYGDRRMSQINRNHSDPLLYGNGSNGAPPPPPVHSYQQSYDTATSGSGSGQSYGTDAWGNSTDPSSEKSSMDRIHQPPPKPDLGEQYGFGGVGGGPDFRGPILEEPRHGQPAYGQPGYGNLRSQQMAYRQGANGQMNGYPQHEVEMPPPPPPHKHAGGARLQRRPTHESGPPAAAITPPAEKRKSWLKRRFSKNP